MTVYEVRLPDGHEAMVSGVFKQGQDPDVGALVAIEREDGTLLSVDPLALVDSDGEAVYRPEPHLLTGKRRAWILAHPEWAKIPPLGRKKPPPSSLEAPMTDP